MKTIKQHIHESKILEAKSSILDDNYSIFPNEWRKFVERARSKGMKWSKEGDYEIVYNNKKEVIARWDELDMKIYTSIPKADFSKTILYGKKDLDKWFVNESQEELSTNDKVKVISGKHQGAVGKIEMLLDKSAILDISANKSIEVSLADIKKL